MELHNQAVVAIDKDIVSLNYTILSLSCICFVFEEQGETLFELISICKRSMSDQGQIDSHTRSDMAHL